MFSKRTEPRSIASQLILLFIVATAILLASGLGIFYAIVVRHAFAEDNAILADKISALRSDLRESGHSVFAGGKRLRLRGVAVKAGTGVRGLYRPIDSRPVRVRRASLRRTLRQDPEALAGFGAVGRG